ncbi:MAG: VWA domain-containing protein [Acidobacteriia bacterium]|nr:VWA domain-containing protein [Terriglobia bacterium]
MRKITLGLAALVLAMLSECTSIRAQNPLRIDLLAFNKENQLVRNLTPGDIEATLDGQPLVVESLTWIPHPPPRMIVLVDAGYTALNNRSLLKDLVAAFLDSKPKYMRIALGAISQPPQFLSAYETSNDELVNNLQKIKLGGDSPLSDSIVASLKRFESDSEATPGRRVLVLITDGTDSSSGDAWGQAVKTITSGKYVLYLINHIQAMRAIFDYRFYDKDLIKLAEQTGGQSYRLKNLDDILKVSAEIYDRETHTYRAVTRTETRVTGAESSRIKIRARRKDVRVEIVAVE